jgi:nucleotide-binding universal stress UspA family protein
LKRRKKKITLEGGKMYEKIVVPLDGSKVGEAALPYVEDIVSKLSPEVKTEVVLLQVLALASIPTVSGRTPAATPYTEQELENSVTDRVLRKEGRIPIAMLRAPR